MNNMQLKTTLVIPTGTGLLYIPYGQDADSATWINGSGATRSKIELKRVRPKPTLTFPGVDRFELKRTTYHTVNSTEYTAVVSVNASIPVPVDSADRLAIWTNLVLMTNVNNTAVDNPLYEAINNGTIPT